MILYRHDFSQQWGEHQGLRLLGCMVTLFLVLLEKKLPNCLPKRLYDFATEWIRVLVSHPHQHLVLSTWGILLILVGIQQNLFVLICTSLMINDAEYFFHMLICHLCFFFGDISIQVFCHFWIQWFLFLLLNFRSSWYIFDISPLTDMWLTNIFSLSMACLHSLSTVFHRAKVFNFKFNLPIYLSFIIALVVPFLNCTSIAC